MMQFIDLKAQYKALKTEIDANIKSILDSAQFIGGSYVKDLEAQLTAFTGRKHCIAPTTLQLAFIVPGTGTGRRHTFSVLTQRLVDILEGEI